MDDARIAELRAEVLSQLRRSPEPAPQGELESRVAALEAAVAELRHGGGASVPAAPRAHPSLQVLHVSGGSGACVMEPDKPCVQSHACRTFGH